MKGELMQIDEIKKQYEQEKEMQVVSFSEPTPPQTVHETTMNEIVGQAVIHQMGNESTKQRVLKTADKVIGTEMSKIENKAEQGEKEAIFQNNKDACDLYGIDEKTVPKWVVQIAKKTQDFWYLIWLIIGSFTIAPIVFLGKKIKVIIKRTWIAMVFATIIYAAIILIPILTTKL